MLVKPKGLFWHFVKCKRLGVKKCLSSELFTTPSWTCALLLLLFFWLTCIFSQCPANWCFDFNCRSALDYCQEATAILEQLSDKVANTDEDGIFHSSAVQDRVAAAYLWQALLEHKATMEEKQTEESPELSESFEADEVLESVTLTPSPPGSDTSGRRG